MKDPAHPDTEEIKEIYAFECQSTTSLINCEAIVLIHFIIRGRAKEVKGFSFREE